MNMHPLFARELYFCLQFFRQEPIKRVLSDLQHTEFLPIDSLQFLQATRMISLLRFAFAQVPFYWNTFPMFKNRVYQVSNFHEVQLLMNDLPEILKDDVLKNYSLLTAENISDIHTYPDKTSGSTGTPIIIPVDQYAWAFRHGLMYRQMQMFGVNIGEPYALFFGLHWNKKTHLQINVRDWVFNRVRISAFDINRITFEKYYKKIQKHSPTFFFGYPSALYDFCFLSREFGFDLRQLKLKAVFTTAEPLLSEQRALIESITGTQCANHYGSAEGGFTAFECPKGNMHIAVESTWLRLKNPSAKVGNVLLTDMMLRAFPLINYSIEDEVELKLGLCECGRQHPLLNSINGRSGEPITLPNGKIINAHVPQYIFKPLAELHVIQRYRFVLQGKDLRLFLVVSNGFTRDHLQIIEQETKKAFGSDIQFSIKIVDDMEHLPNAKHRSFIEIPEHHNY